MLISASKKSEAFSLQKSKTFSARAKYIDPTCRITDATIRNQLHTCYLTESQWHLYVSLNSFSGAQSQSPEKKHKENVCACSYKITLMLLVCILFFKSISLKQYF